MSDTLIVFAATYLSVFTLGLQSLNVNQGHYLAAGVTSFFISTGHIFLYKFMPDSGVAQLAGYYIGGIAGITTSIWFHKRARALLAAWWNDGTGRFAFRVPSLSKDAARPVDEHASDIYPACQVCGTAAGRCCPRLVCERYPESRH